MFFLSTKIDISQNNYHIITSNAILTENANKPRMIGFIDIDNYSPFPKNPKIARFFKEIGLADELGSGIKKIAQYTKIYSGGIPEFKEDEIFKVIIPLSKTNNNEQITIEMLRDLIYEYIKEGNGKTRKEINEYIYPILNDKLDIMSNKVRTTLTYLRRKSLIQNIGSDTKSMWKCK